MNLISIKDINDQFLSYKGTKSLKKWISGNGLSVIRLGKVDFVEKNAFENLIKTLAGADIPIKETPLKLKSAEDKIFTHLQRRISEL